MDTNLKLIKNFMSYKIIITCNLLYLTLLLSFQAQSSVSISQPHCNSDSPHALNVVVASRRETIETESLQKGVLSACDQNWKTPVNISFIVYDNVRDGVERIKSLVGGKNNISSKVNIIIGPTESQVFSDLIEQLEFYKRPVPVISPIVTLRLGNKPDGWFFRTNVDVVKRTRTMYDFLSDKSVENISLLYADRAFGEKVENEFRGELTESQRSSFKSYRFKTAEDARKLVREIVKERPESIGIIGSRDDIKHISPMIVRSSNIWNEYKPYVFSIIDTRSLKENGSYFLSVGSPAEAPVGTSQGEVLDLSYDTMILVMTIADALFSEEIKPTDDNWQVQFRNRLVVSLSSSQSPLVSRTGMEFSGLRNTAVPKIMTVKNRKAEVVGSYDYAYWISPVVNWFDIRQRRFGKILYANILIIVCVVLFLTIVDLKKSHRVSKESLKEWPFLNLMIFNVCVAVTVFVVMAEHELIEWNSMLSAVMIAFGYAGLLKTTIFQFESGKAIGIKYYYDCWVSKVYDDIRKNQYDKDGDVVNYIIYTNSKKYLRDTLIDSYGFAHDEKRKKDLIRKLDETVEKESTTIRQRTILAKTVLREISWDKMVEQRIVPSGVKENEVKSLVPLLDKCVKHCFRQRKPTLKQVVKMVDKALEYSELRNEFDSDFKRATTPYSKMLACFRWLILLEGYDEQRMVKQGFISDEILLEKKQNKKEKRNEERVASDKPIDVVINNTKVTGTLVDVSNNGARIVFNESVKKYPEEQHASVIFDDGKKPIENVNFNVTNKKTNENGAVEIGVCWESLSKPDANSMKSFVSTENAFLKKSGVINNNKQ